LSGDATRNRAIYSPAYAAPESSSRAAPLPQRPTCTAWRDAVTSCSAKRCPWQIEDLPLAIAVRRLLEVKPVPPSAAPRVGPRSRRASCAATSMPSSLSPCAKEPQARYPDARALAGDIRRHIHHEPIRARDGAARLRAPPLLAAQLAAAVCREFGICCACSRHRRQPPGRRASRVAKRSEPRSKPARQLRSRISCSISSSRAACKIQGAWKRAT